MPKVIALTLFVLCLVIWSFGITIKAGAASIFVIVLLMLAIIDLYTYLLPDMLTQPLIWIGLLFNLNGMFVPLHEAVIGAVAGYMSLWLLNKIYRLWRQQEGIGHGDFKLAAALGAWLGYRTLFGEIFIMALLSSSAVGIWVILNYLLQQKGSYLASLFKNKIHIKNKTPNTQDCSFNTAAAYQRSDTKIDQTDLAMPIKSKWHQHQSLHSVLQTPIPFGPFLSAAGIVALLFPLPLFETI